MKFPLSLLPFATLLLAAGSSSAAIYSTSWNAGFLNGGVVPDGNAAGWSDTRSIAVPAGETVTDVNVILSLSGGWNGDLYAYLANPNAPGVAVLLNRPGRTGANAFGYGDNLLTITLDDGGANGDSHYYQSAVSYFTAISSNGAFQPDGRPTSPLAVVGTEPRTAMLSLFNGISASTGGWTLFVADLSTGDVTTVNGWGIVITTVPEPGSALLGLAAAGALLLRRGRRGAPGVHS